MMTIKLMMMNLTVINRFLVLEVVVDLFPLQFQDSNFETRLSNHFVESLFICNPCYISICKTKISVLHTDRQTDTDTPTKRILIQ